MQTLCASVAPGPRGQPVFAWREPPRPAAQAGYNAAEGGGAGDPQRRTFLSPTTEGDQRNLWGQGRPMAKDSSGSGQNWDVGTISQPQNGSMINVESRLDFTGTVAPTDMDRATDAREKERIGIFGTGLSYAGSYGRVTSESIGRDLNPLGRGNGYAYIAGELIMGKLYPERVQYPVPGGTGNSVNNPAPGQGGHGGGGAGDCCCPIECGSNCVGDGGLMCPNRFGVGGTCDLSKHECLKKVGLPAACCCCNFTCCEQIGLAYPAGHPAGGPNMCSGGHLSAKVEPSPVNTKGQVTIPCQSCGSNLGRGSFPSVNIRGRRHPGFGLIPNGGKPQIEVITDYCQTSFLIAAQALRQAVNGGFNGVWDCCCGLHDTADCNVCDIAGAALKNFQGPMFLSEDNSLCTKNPETDRGTVGISNCPDGQLLMRVCCNSFEHPYTAYERDLHHSSGICAAINYILFDAYECSQGNAKTLKCFEVIRRLSECLCQKIFQL